MMSALKALAAAQAVNIAIEVQADKLVLRGPDLSSDSANNVIDLLVANKPDLLRILNWREAAMAVLKSKPPPGCWPNQWAVARRGLVSFMSEGWETRLRSPVGRKKSFISCRQSRGDASI
jgi:hypothetical protein